MVIEKIKKSKIIAVVVIEDLEDVQPLMTILSNGGITAIELALRTPVSFKAAAFIKKEFPEILLGLGTVLQVDQVKRAVAIGADFAVAPGCNPKVIDEAQKQGLFFAPGIMTPTDIEIALENNCRVMKYFPAESSGGLAHLNTIVTPYKHLNLSFIPLGGCNVQNAPTYLASPLVIALGGSWIATQELIGSKNWAQITQNVADVKKLLCASN